MTRALIALLLSACLMAGNAHAGSIAPYKVVAVDWKAATSSDFQTSPGLAGAVRSLPGYAKQSAAARTRTASLQGADDLVAINTVFGVIRPQVTEAGSPVLLPVDIDRLASDMVSIRKLLNKDAIDSYSGPFKSNGFYPGRYGYRAYFTYGKISSVTVAGSSILFDIPTKVAMPKIKPCGELIGEARRSLAAGGDAEKQKFLAYLTAYENQNGEKDNEYFSEREAAVPCQFAGALVEVSILCDKYDDVACSVAEIGREVFARLNFVGGAPQGVRSDGYADHLRDLVARRAAVLATARTPFPTYAAEGQLLPASVAGGGDVGAGDAGIYGLITFPTTKEAAAQTVVFRTDETCLPGWVHDDLAKTCAANGVLITMAKPGDWRDNFCERRGGNRLFSCPSGYGHAGQDVWGVDWRGKSDKFALYAPMDGIAFRRFSAQPAVTISDINGLNIDYVYRHMRPSSLRLHGIKPATPVRVTQGCVIALVGNLQGEAKDAPTVDDGHTYAVTAPHLHLEIRAPTASGFANVAPYATLVDAHKAVLVGDQAQEIQHTSCS
jgi:hypothetical protein